MRAVMGVSSITANLRLTIRTFAEGVIHPMFRKKAAGTSAAVYI
jgi:hypothetical protein